MHTQQELSQSAEYLSSWQLYFQLAALFRDGSFFLGGCVVNLLFFDGT
jgi:hypothetical protein